MVEARGTYWSSLVAMTMTATLVVASVVIYPSAADAARAAAREDLLASDVWFSFPLVGLVFAATGLAIHRHRPNLVGWVLHGIGLPLAASMVGTALAIDGVIGGALGVSGRVLAGWVDFGWIPALMLMTVFLPLLFPTGRPPSPRWWWVGVAGGGSVVYAFVSVTLESLMRPLDELSGGWPVVPIALVTATLGAGASVVVRYRRAADVERHQLKWVSAALLLVCTIVAVALTPLAGDVLTGELAQLVVMGAWCTIPVSVGIAITRYHLYDIDRIVSRTVSYAVVALIVAAVYAGVVVVLGWRSAPVAISPSRRRPWRPRRWSVRPSGASRSRPTAASTGRGTTRNASSTRSRRACATAWSSPPSPTTWSARSVARFIRPRSRCGSACAADLHIAARPLGDEHPVSAHQLG